MTSTRSAPWKKSTRSNGTGSACIEVVVVHDDAIAIRDSKLPTTGDFPVLVMTKADWIGLLCEVAPHG